MANNGIHTYQNGIRCWERTIYPGALKRCKQHVNLHEPLQEVIFKSLLSRKDIRSYVNLGAGWGYYLLLARCLRPDLNIIGVDGDESMVRATRDNFLLNDVTDIQVIQSWLGVTHRADTQLGLLDDLLQHERLQSATLMTVDIEGAAEAMLKAAPKTRKRVSEMLIGTHAGEHWECLKLLKIDGRWLIRLAVEPGQIPLQPDGLVWATRIPICEEFPWPEKLVDHTMAPDWLEEAVNNPGSFSVNGVPFLLAHNQFGKYCIPLIFKGRGEAKAVIEGSVWERETLGFLRQHAGDGDVVHAGTFFGDMLPGLSSACCEQGVVWSFEPNAISYMASRMTLQINRISNVVLSNKALGGEEGIEKMLVRNADGHNLGGRCRIESDMNHPAQLTDQVKVTALDQVIPSHRRVSMIHLDVEGYEHQALKGALALIRRDRPLIVLETVPKQPWFEQVSLKELGYRVLRKVDGNTAFISDRAN